jgi:hypothetical protein
MPNVLVKEGLVTRLRSGRITLPLLFEEGWHDFQALQCTIHRPMDRRLNWDVTAVSLAEALAISDAAGLDVLATPPLLPDSAVSIRPLDPTAAVEFIFVEFESLLDKPDVDEVRDINLFFWRNQSDGFY